MRIVYEYDRNGAAARRSLPPGPGRETVLVISARKGPSGGESRASPGSDAAYEVRISDEARARDRAVRAHEEAHLSVLGGAAASPVLYDIVSGPGGENVATGGRIAVDMSEVPGDPEATLRKARRIIAAAYAPGDPSAADARTAARAYDMARKAREEISREGLPPTYA